MLKEIFGFWLVTSEVPYRHIQDKEMQHFEIGQYSDFSIPLRFWTFDVTLVIIKCLKMEIMVLDPTSFDKQRHFDGFFGIFLFSLWLTLSKIHSYVDMANLSLMLGK